MPHYPTTRFLCKRNFRLQRNRAVYSSYMNRLTLPVDTPSYRGVAWHERNRKWVAKTHACGKYLTLGYFDKPEDAARMYDAAAHLIRGPNATFNFNGQPPPNIPLVKVANLLRRRGLVLSCKE